VALHDDIRNAEKEFATEIETTPPNYRRSVINFTHYLNLHRHDFRKIQIRLGQLGLSTLGRLEAHVMAGIETVIAVIERLLDTSHSSALNEGLPMDFDTGNDLLSQHTDEIFGSRSNRRSMRIMVTLPSEAATGSRNVCTGRSGGGGRIRAYGRGAGANSLAL
jgi:pyruvate kinase